MPTLEAETRELNSRLTDLAYAHGDAIGEHFAAGAALTGELHASRLFSVGDLLAVPPALLPIRAMDRFRRHHAAFQEAVRFIYDVRFGRSWERLADALGIAEDVRPYIDFGRPPRLTDISRPDVVLCGDSVVMAEPNFGTSAGAQEDADVLGRMFDTAPVIGDHLRRIGARRADVVGPVADLLRRRLKDAERSADGLVVVTELGHDIDFFHNEGLARELRRHGINAVAHATENLEADGGRVTVFGHPVDLIYRLAAEQPDPVGNLPVLEPLLTAARAGQVVLLDDLTDQIAGHKTIMALISEELEEDRLPRTIRAHLADFVPWSRIVRDGPAVVDGVRVDLLEWCRDHRDDLVVKPGPGHMGRGVTIGEETAPGEWEEILRTAHDSEELWLVQSLARSEQARVSVVRGESLHSEDTYVDYSYFAVGDGIPTAGLRKHPPLGAPTRRVKRCGLGPVYFV